MKNPDSSLLKITPEKELKHFKAIIRSIMIGASKTLALIELLSHGAEIEEEISLSDHYLNYTERLCERETGDQKRGIDCVGWPCWEKPGFRWFYLFCPAD